MPLLILGLILWTAVHGVKIHAPDKRKQLSALLGVGGSRILMTVLMVCAVTLIVIGYQRADWIFIWSPPGFLTHVNNLLMVAAISLFIAGGVKSWLGDKVRHPQLAGMKTWAIAHLLVNGDLASIVMFGSLLAWAVVSLIAINKRDGKPARVPRATVLGTVLHIAGTLGIFVGVALLHNYLGVWPFAGRT